MSLIFRIFSSRSKLFQIVGLVILSAITETLLLFNLSSFGSPQNLKEDSIALLFLLTFMALFARLASLWLVNHRCLSSISDLNTNLLDVVHSKSLSGRLQSHNFISTAEKVQIIGTSVLVPVINGIASLFIGVFIFCALVTLYGSLVVWVVLLIILFYTAVVLSLRGLLDSNSKILAKYQTSRASLISEASEGAIELEVTGTVDKQKNRFRQNEKSFVSSATKVLFLGGMPRFILESALIITMILFVTLQNDVNLGINDIITFGFGCLRLVPLAQQSYNGWARYRGNSAAIYEVSDALNNFDSKHKNPFIKNAQIKRDGDQFSAEWQTKLPNVSMPASLKIRFKEGNFTFLSGDSGTGKTSLIIDLIAALHSEGISVGLVASYNARFSYTVREYFNFFDQLNSEELSNLIELFNLSYTQQHAFLDKKVSDLSTGEFQRLQIIRELLRKPQLLILDEALSNLDKRLVKQALLQFKLLGRTAILIISHAPITAKPKLMEIKLGE